MTDIYPSRRAPQAEILPRLDPVVHSDWSADAPISRDQAAQFEADGYLVLDDLFSEEEIAFLQGETGRLLADPPAPHPGNRGQRAGQRRNTLDLRDSRAKPGAGTAGGG